MSKFRKDGADECMICQRNPLMCDIHEVSPRDHRFFEEGIRAERVRIAKAWYKAVYPHSLRDHLDLDMEEYLRFVQEEKLD